MFERPHLQSLKKRVTNEPRRFIQVIYGPRQVGKTTLVQQLLQQAGLVSHYASADAVMSAQGNWISQQWDLARLALSRSGATTGLLVIDEVQKIDNWSEWVKREWDADTIRSIDLRVVILGSSRLLLQKGHSESLAGRFETTYLGHWSWPEMRDAFGLSISQFVWFGGYPGAAALIGDEFRWKTYLSNSLIEASISRDIVMLTQVNKPALLKQLFELGCLFSGQILSFNKALGQLQDAGNTTTLAHYLNLLHQAGLLSGLQKAGPSALHKRASSPKFQVHNTALLSAQQPRLHQEVEGIPAEWGRWVESAVGAHLLNQAQFHGMELQYWRQDNQEVDFVLRHRDRLIGLEVKSGSHSRRSGLQAFDKECQPHKTYLIGTGGLPWATFLEMDIRELF